MLIPVAPADAFSDILSNLFHDRELPEHEPLQQLKFQSDAKATEIA